MAATASSQELVGSSTPSTTLESVQMDVLEISREEEGQEPRLDSNQYVIPECEKTMFKGSGMKANHGDNKIVLTQFCLICLLARRQICYRPFSVIQFSLPT